MVRLDRTFPTLLLRRRIYIRRVFLHLSLEDIGMSNNVDLILLDPNTAHSIHPHHDMLLPTITLGYLIERLGNCSIAI